MSIISSTFALKLPMLAADHLGFFKDAGLDVEFVKTTGSRAQFEELYAGKIDLAHTAVDNVVGRAVDEPGRAKIVQVASLGNDQLAVGGVGIERVEDVRGRTVGVDAPDSGYAFALFRLLENHGLTADDYELAAVGGPGLRLEGLQSGELQIGLLNPPLARRAEASGMKVLDKVANHFPGYPSISTAVGTDQSRLDRSELIAYSVALGHAVKWADDPANRERAIELVAKDRDCDLGMAEQLYEEELDLREVGCPTVEQTRAGIKLVADLRADFTGATIPDPEVYVAFDLMEEIDRNL